MSCFAAGRPHALVARMSAFIVALAMLAVASTSFAVQNPVVDGPIPATAPPGDPSRNYPFLATTLFPPGSGYIEEEFFFEGKANRYTTNCGSTLCPASASEQRASVVSSGHSYRARMIVRRPADPTRFNGKVIVEWQNVTNNWELDVQWYRAADYFIREGYVWVGIGPQRAGVHGTPNGLRAWNPSRYGSLDVTDSGTITDDALQWDIFSQAGQAIANPAGRDPLQGLGFPRTLIATGDSQSSSRLATYLNAVHPLDPVYDGFVLGGPLGIPIRNDTGVKVLKVISEWDLIAREAAVRQPNTQSYVAWEVAGSSHSDYHNFVVNSPVRLRDVGVTGILPDTTNCIDPARSRANLHLVFHAAYDWMVRWLEGEQPPSMATPIAIDPNATGGDTLLRNALGLAEGGVRLPEVEVPVATNTGWNTGGKAPTSAGACQQAGTYVPFDEQTLTNLYGSHDLYVLAFAQAAERAVQAGFLLREDADRLVREARNGDVLRRPHPQGLVRVVEWFRALSQQYFWTAVPEERALLDRGGAGGDWIRTGQAFVAWNAEGIFPNVTVPVCRFFGRPEVGPAEHFFTANAVECGSLQADPAWIYEGTAFRVLARVEGVCPTGQVSMLRLFKPGSDDLGSRHRYVLDPALAAQLVEEGWLLEGHAFCVTPE